MVLRVNNRAGAGLALFLCLPALLVGQKGWPQTGAAALVETAQVEAAQAAPSPPDPVLTHRPPPKSTAALAKVTPEGRIHVDVLVTDSAGKPVSGLQPWDFKLLDDGQPRKILSFRSVDGAAVKPDPPVEVILLFDTANLPFQEVSFTRQEIMKFLRQNGGHLAQPVSIFLLSDAGLRIQPRPSVDGNALATVVDQIKGSVHAINAAMGAAGDVERFQLSVRQITAIAENEARRPGRKLLIWVGPGWPMLDRRSIVYSEKEQQRYFDGIVELSTRLREARMAVYSVSAAGPGLGAGADRTFLYQDFLRGVKSPRQADTGNLALKVLVSESGGRILGPDNELAAQIDSCIAEANAFYTLSFDPPRPEHADEYHDLKVQVAQPALTVRTNTGYYNQP
jgi:VWFA-related protein